MLIQSFKYGKFVVEIYGEHKLYVDLIVFHMRVTMESGQNHRIRIAEGVRYKTHENAILSALKWIDKQRLI